MVKAAVDTKRTLMSKKDNIRNACVIAPSDHDKAILMDSLMAAAGTANEAPSDFRLTRAGALAQEVLKQKTFE
ncbi:hypothetical protein SETIT_1G119600v2 [Setaria italica]|uniref:Uncharacterized protein n=1 Tax=Setaria italica TaxID=4555 RepID=K3Z048_SETIT|nr:hypothetical protein SETIT_1G119600v2 [Setaria italica]